MRAAFIPALPPSALMGGMIAPSFRLVNRFCGKSCCARAAAVGGRPRCAHYGLGRRSLAGGSHPHPTLAVAWAAFAANAGGTSVASARWSKKRGMPPRGYAGPAPATAAGRSAARARSRRGRRVPAPTARAMGAQRPRASVSSARWRKKRGSRHPAAVPAGPHSCAPPGRSPAARARSRRGRRVSAPTARAVGAHRPCASVSSAQRAQETRHVPPPRSLRRANRPHQPSEVWRAAALQVKSYRPAPPGGRGVCAPRRKHSLHVSPAAPKAQGKRAPPGGKDRRQPSFSDELIAVCRSSPRCPR